ncbi:MAG: hypothetical protein ACI9YM_001323 [Brevundimonas sp.]|jgi:hypothetical protein|uniref:hypothetical protein n=1 Tax=Brevundimonas sp. TaxID=1871086 RepID=UPI00248A8C08|nr:hypothetical protein [Brevundimonas sp.]MDI1280614.1 hypothetical protein [Brevundimonas sp.]
MIRTVMLVSLVLGTAACAMAVYDPEPVTPQQWQERQDRIARETAERDRLCAITRPEDPRHDQLCNSLPKDRP